MTRRNRKRKFFKLVFVLFALYLIKTNILDDKALSFPFDFQRFGINSLYKTDDKTKLRKNIEKQANKGNDKARWIYDNFDSLSDTLIYLSGNDSDTIEFTYNYANGITNFAYYEGESYNLDRKTPYFIQWDNRWAYNDLGQSNIGIAGCGPTSMAMVLSRLTGDPSITPTKIASDAYGYMDGNGIAWSFFKDEANRYGYGITDIANDKEAMIDALEYGPLIVSVDRGYFTLFGHILVIDSYKDGKFLINDPNSIKRSQKKWSYRQIEDQIVHIWLVN